MKFNTLVRMVFSGEIHNRTDKYDDFEANRPHVGYDELTDYCEKYGYFHDADDVYDHVDTVIRMLRSLGFSKVSDTDLEDTYYIL